MAKPAFAPDGEALLDQLNRLGSLHWTHTWVARANDFAAATPLVRERVIRVQLMRGGDYDGLWHWSIITEHDEVSRNAGPTNGYEMTCVEAGEQAEMAWIAATKGTSLERRQDLRNTRNAYAAAKDPE